MDEQKKFQPRQDGVYRTGGESPPKKGGAVLPAVLMCVIVLAGALRLCGGIQGSVLQQLEGLFQDAPIVFSAAEQSRQTVPSSEDSTAFPALGFSGKAVSHLWQAYYRLPAGIVVTEVTSSGIAAAKGIQPGDILVSFQDQPVTDAQNLNALLMTYRPGDAAQLVLYRDAKQYRVFIRLGE